MEADFKPLCPIDKRVDSFCRLGIQLLKDRANNKETHISYFLLVRAYNVVHCIVAFSGALQMFVTVLTYFNDANHQLQFC